MSTTVRPEVSEKNPYWIDRHRYYELKHFCLQYPIWRKARASIDSMQSKPIDIPAIINTNIADQVAKCTEMRLYYSERIDMVERCAKEASEELSNYILKAVTEGYSYNYLKTYMLIPCCKEVYYKCLRKFYWLLSELRK
jgi:hypothetical protein